MNFLFIAYQLGQVGGIETLISRMSNWLIMRNHKVTLLTDHIKDCKVLFNKNLKIIDLGNNFADLCCYNRACSTWMNLKIDRPDTIKAFDLTSSWIASVLSSIIDPKPKVIFGDYYPYIIPESRNPFKFANWRLFLLNIKWTFNNGSVLCMSKEQISEFRRYDANGNQPIFWPLPVEDPIPKDYTRYPKWGHIVSVGRLDIMKEYNIYMIDVVANLLRKGYSITWTVYGDGPLAEVMKTRIDKLGLNNEIRLKGRLDYLQYAAAMKDAYLFVGMGTSVIEAALCGVPGVVALAHDTSGVTYGPLYNFPFGNCGERTDNEPDKLVENEIERILKLTDDEYTKEIDKTREYAKQYNMENSMNKFINIVNDQPAAKINRFLFYWYYVHRTMEIIRNSIKNS